MMESVTSFFQPFFDWLGQTTLTAGIVTCLILAVQKTLGGRLGPRWCHALWLVLLVRMVLPWAPSSRFSLANLIPSRDRQVQVQQLPAVVEHQEADSPVEATENSETVSEKQPQSGVTLREMVAPKPNSLANAADKAGPLPASIRLLLPILWLAGAMLVMAYILVSDLALWRIVKRDRPLMNQQMLELFEDCKAQMDIQSLVVVVPSSHIRSPGLFGFIRPRLLLPKEMLDSATQEEMRYVFLHELAHLKRHDIYLGWLTSLLQILHWFNPLVWYAFYRMRTDRELACDALVLTQTGQDKSHEYGGAILGLVRRFSRSRPLPAMAGIMESKSQLKRRISMITKFRKKSYRFSPLAIALLILVGCVSVSSPKHNVSSQVSTLEQRSNTTLRKLKGQWGGFGNISSDGKYLCGIGNWDDGNLMVWDLATGKRWPVTKNGPDESVSHYALDAAISPDSTKVAYLWYEERTAASSLWLAGLDGSGRRLLCKGKYIMPKDWSADGSKILAVVYGNPHQMVWISASDGSIQKIKDVGTEYPGKFDISPDGRFIAYDMPQANDTIKRDVFLYDLAADHNIHLIESPSDDVLLGWTPDGKSIFFSSDRTGTWDGWLLNLRDGKPVGIPQRIKPALGEVEAIGFRANGDYYFAVYGTRRSVYTASFDPQTCLISFPPNPVRQTGSQNAPTWSPNGKYLAYFDIKKKHAPVVICIRSVVTGQAREIEPNLSLAGGDLHWAPDGRRLLMTGSADRNRSHFMIYQIDVQTGQCMQLVHSKNMELWGAQWLPDGKRLLYCRRSNQDETTVPRTASLVVRDIDTKNEKELVQVELPDALNSWALSPDGHQIAVETCGKTSGGISLVSVDDGQKRDLLGRNWAKKIRIVAAWSPDGDYIFLLIRPDLKSKPTITELWRIAAQGGQPEKIQTFDKLPLIGMQIHPGGKKVALCTHEGLYELWVMENFLPKP